MNRLSFEFWFDFASTYSYLSASRILDLTHKEGIAVLWKPFLLGPVFKSQGWDTSPFNIYEAKGNYMWRDIERMCEKYNIAYIKPSEFPRNGLLAARVAVAFENESWVPEFIRAVFSANFTEDKDISNEEIIYSILRTLELDARKIIQSSSLQENKDNLRAQTQLAGQKGIFGAPTFAIGNEIFWGNDRLEDAIEFYILAR